MQAVYCFCDFDKESILQKISLLSYLIDCRLILNRKEDTC